MQDPILINLREFERFPPVDRGQRRALCGGNITLHGNTRLFPDNRDWPRLGQVVQLLNRQTGRDL
jgi:hypothetical protein